MNENKPVSFLVPHLIGNPVDAVDTYIQLAKRQLKAGNYTDALDLMEKADECVEQTKQVIQDFRTGKYNTQS